jgi:hypothetical protein
MTHLVHWEHSLSRGRSELLDGGQQIAHWGWSKLGPCMTTSYTGDVNSLTTRA